MEQLFWQATLNWRFNVLVSTLAVIFYLINYFVLKTKREYRGLHWQIFLLFSLAPGFNLLFLLLNTMLFAINKCNYRIVKVKKRSNAKTGRTVKA